MQLFSMRPLGLSALGLCILATLAAGCRGGRDNAPMEVIGERDGSGMPGSGGDGAILPGVDVTSTHFNPSKDLQTVYFAYDSAALEAPARAALDDAAKHLRNHPGMLIQIAGHCDERGTQEYNLALGERRAQSVRDYLRQLGVPGDRLITMSYGEEVPAVLGGDETAWSQNRRCEFSEAQ